MSKRLKTWYRSRPIPPGYVTGREVTEAEKPVCPTPAFPGLLSGLDVPSNYPQSNTTQIGPEARADTQSCLAEALPGLLFCALALGLCLQARSQPRLPAKRTPCYHLIFSWSWEERKYHWGFKSLNVTSSDIPEAVSTAEANRFGSV